MSGRAEREGCLGPLASRVLWALVLVCGCGLVACGDDGPAPGGAGGTGAGGAGGAVGAGGAGGEVPVVDPALFDCTRVKDPERNNPVPVTCAMDVTCTTQLVSGHRGAPTLAPEDTVASVRAAIALGVDFVETDPRPTKDGYLVNLHDTSVDRTTSGTGEAIDLTLAEIQALTLENYSMPGDFSCEHVPTLEEILTAARGKVHVLIDANKTDRVDLLVGAILATDTVDWAVFDTSSVDKIDQALAIEPNLHTMIRVDTVEELDAELTHFAAHPPIIVEITGTATSMIDEVHLRNNRAMRDLFVIDVVADLNDDASAYGQVFELGLDIGQTDRPDLVLEYLGRR
ncbi:MAG: glycerophosphodiester phosphodiesterase family protein [Polyangiaceae bacterium]